MEKLFKKCTVIVILFSLIFGYISPFVVTAEEGRESSDESVEWTEESNDTYDEIEFEEEAIHQEEDDSDEEVETSVDEEQNSEAALGEPEEMEVMETEDSDASLLEEEIEHEEDSLEEVMSQIVTTSSSSSIQYRAHVQSIGWQNNVANGEIAGTTGERLRVEALQFDLSEVENLQLRYRSNVEGRGWTGWVTDGQTTGTTGEGRQLEAIQIELQGAKASNYDIYYRVHSQSFGWMGWASNGQPAGTEGYGYRIEAVQVRIVERGSSAPGSTNNAFRELAVPNVHYRSHVQSIGWQNEVSNGEISGTTDQVLRIEALRFRVSGISDLQIRYRSKIQDGDWTAWSSNDQTTGTTGQRRYVEAVQLELQGGQASNYDIYYRVHTQSFGWLDWARNGEAAGTDGYDYRIEAIQVRIVPRGSAAPGSTSRPFRELTPPNVRYETHVQSIGWQSAVENGVTAGTINQRLRLEGIRLSITNQQNLSGNIEYRTHVQSEGWQGWRSNGSNSGTTGQQKRLEAIEIRLTGELAEHYDIYYRTHIQSEGWLGWVRNGMASGSEGLGLRMEAIQVRLVPKGTGDPVHADSGFIQPPLIYIDPGHGGSEPGAISGGVREKDLNLQIAHRINNILISRGYRTVMSRTTDRQVSLSARAQEANRLNADIFVSIHFNAFQGTAQGIETYFYNQSGNTSNPYANNASRINSSRNLANSIHTNVLSQTGAVNRNVRSANFHVLRETHMPAVLLELGYMDHPAERARIVNSNYQHRLSLGVTAGIDRYFGR